MKNINAKVLFGSIIVIILLGLYGYSLIKAMILAWTGPNIVETLPEGISRTLATVGGLVSALVIAALAITKPKETPGARLFVASTNDTPIETPDWVTGLSWLYVLVWIVLGFTAFLFGEMWFPDKVPPLTEYARAWLGLAVAAGYAYFGIQN